jgi:hypothetical protein
MVTEFAKLTPENLQLFLMLVVPGFIALTIYDLFIPSERRAASETLVQATTYGMINLGLMSWAVVLMRGYELADRAPVAYAAATVGMLVVTPALLGWAVFRVRTSRFARGWLQHPMPTAWDYFFATRQPGWVIFHLKNGQKVGGIYGGDSYATSYPNEPEVYVRQVWRVDELGRFTSRVERSLGMIVRQAECDVIEFFNAKG